MRHMFAVCLFAMFAVVGCGGGSSGGDDDNPAVDAPSGTDAPVTPDAPSGLSGLGQSCGQGGGTCPANAPVCLTAPGSTAGFCSAECLTGGTFMTNAQGQIASANPNPMTMDGMCASIYTGGAEGSPRCIFVTTFQPMDNPLQPNKNYTNATWTCGILCGAGNTCPTGLTCRQGACTP